MFTGIVEEVGTVMDVRPRADVRRTTIRASRVLEDLNVGDSISIDGACHTVVSQEDETFAVESVQETLNRTTLGRLEAGVQVNLELPLRVGDRLGGHFVMGHVDATGRVLERQVVDESAVFRIEMPRSLARFVTEKGSVTVDGISLTVVSAEAGAFTFAAIPHTLAETTLSQREPGDAVNLEVDMVARYLEGLIPGAEKGTEGVG